MTTEMILGIAGTVISTLMGVAVFLFRLALSESNRARDEKNVAQDARVTKIEAALAAHRELIHAVELSVAKCATNEQLSSMTGRLEQMHGAISAMRDQMDRQFHARATPRNT